MEPKQIEEIRPSWGAISLDRILDLAERNTLLNASPAGVGGRPTVFTNSSEGASSSLFSSAVAGGLE